MGDLHTNIMNLKADPEMLETLGRGRSADYKLGFKDARHAAAEQAALDAAEARAVVKPLVFADEYGDGILTSRETGKLKRVIPQNGGGFYASSLSTEVYPTAEAAVAAYQADHVAFVLRCLHPASPLGAVAIEKALIAKRWQRNYPPYGEHFGDWSRLNDKEITCAIMDWAAPGDKIAEAAQEHQLQHRIDICADRLIACIAAIRALAEKVGV